MVNGTTYNESHPTGTEILTNSVGCDSIININLVYVQPNSAQITPVGLYVHPQESLHSKLFLLVAFGQVM
jgi:hypothetical protein